MSISSETPSLQSEKAQRAIDSATGVFTRYGYARTTMGDIAKGAGMSRPALYLLFPDKQAIFARVVAAMDDAKHAEIEAAIAGVPELTTQLREACTRWGLHGVELTNDHPDAADLFDLRFPAVQAVYARFEALIVRLIAPAVAASSLDASAEELARTLVYGMRGLLAVAVDLAHMRRLIEVQVDTLVSAIAGKSAN